MLCSWLHMLAHLNRKNDISPVLPLLLLYLCARRLRLDNKTTLQAARTAL